MPRQQAQPAKAEVQGPRPTPPCRLSDGLWAFCSSLAPCQQCRPGGKAPRFIEHQRPGTSNSDCAQNRREREVGENEPPDLNPHRGASAGCAGGNASSRGGPGNFPNPRAPGGWPRMGARCAVGWVPFRPMPAREAAGWPWVWRLGVCWWGNARWLQAKKEPVFFHWPQGSPSRRATVPGRMVLWSHRRYAECWPGCHPPPAPAVRARSIAYGRGCTDTDDSNPR